MFIGVKKSLKKVKYCANYGRMTAVSGVAASGLLAAQPSYFMDYSTGSEGENLS